MTKGKNNIIRVSTSYAAELPKGRQVGCRTNERIRYKRGASTSTPQTRPGVTTIRVEIGKFLFQRLLVDIQEASKCPLDAPDDISYDWLLIEAPILEKQVLAYIEGSRIEHPDFPLWVKPLWDKFLSTKEALYLRLLRQLLLFCYKIEHEPKPEQLQAAQAAFEETDDMVGTWESSANCSNSFEPIYTTARQYVGSVIYRINWREIIPSHGPGAVYPPRKAHKKSKFSTLYTTIQERYPFDQFFCGLPSFWKEVMVEEVTGTLEESSCITAKLTAVPKDSRGPRLICVHPSESIWIQQGQRRLLEDAIGSHPLIRDVIKFRDQTQNGRLALESSRTGYLCTLDLKEASDRISPQLVRKLFGDYAYEWLSCARASHIKLFDGRVRELKKWAPMGNALTFPVQSLIFFSLVRAGIRCRYGVSCNEVYVFGDDILFPSKYYEGAIRALVMSGLVPNTAKTFRRGLFRESCGVDAYNGEDVTPLRLKKMDVSQTQDALSLMKLAKRARQKGFEHCATAIYSLVSRHWGRLPLCNNPDASGFVEYVRCGLDKLFLYEPSMRFRRDTQQWAVPTRLVRNCNIAVPLGDWYHLQDSLLRITRMGDVISDRGTEYADPYGIRLNYGWSVCLPGGE